MKKLIIAVCVAGIAGGLFAASAKAALTPEEKAARKAKAAEEFYKSTGGKLLDTRKMKGRVVYVNAQSSAKEEWLKESAKYFFDHARVTVDVEKGTFEFPKVKKVGEVTVFVIEDPQYPSVLAAPDQGWAAVNVAPLKEGAGAKPQFFEARVKKSITRAFAAAAGGFDSAYPGNVVGPVAAVADLDRYQDYYLAVDVLKRFVPALKAHGITQYKVSTYDQACMEGWAPQPKDAVQKEIWDEIHKLPENPLKIKPESQRK